MRLKAEQLERVQSVGPSRPPVFQLTLSDGLYARNSAALRNISPHVEVRPNSAVTHQLLTLRSPLDHQVMKKDCRYIASDDEEDEDDEYYMVLE